MTSPTTPSLFTRVAMQTFGLLAVAVTSILAGLLLPSGSAQAAAATVTTLARLGGDPNGYHPRTALVDGLDGFFYGTTEAGGPPNCGTVFKVAPDGILTTLHAFAGTGDGAQPQAGLVLASNGNFYGTTSCNSYDANNGRSGHGTIFRIASDGTFTTLHVFADDNTQVNNPAEGNQPLAALLQALRRHQRGRLPRRRRGVFAHDRRRVLEGR